jgi:phosphatidylglycerol---prolipoprotein diacylglyceryl transferase
MYPTISDLLNDLFGFYLPLPIQTFGFLLAISFLCAALTLRLELLRKEKLGLIRPVTVVTIKGQPATPVDLFVSSLTGFLLGYKVVYMVFNYTEFVNDTQGVLLSMKGNLLGGLTVGAILAYLRYREAEKEKLPQPERVVSQMHPYELVGNFTMIAAVAGIIGAKLFHNLENLDELLRDPVDALLSFSGLTMYGGLILGAAAVMWYGRKQGIQPLMLADATAPGLMLAYGTGRLGCQLSGDGDWGVVNLQPKPDWLSWLPDWAWSYNYPNNVISEGIPIPGCIGRHCMMLPDAVFPTPLYEAIVCILLFFVIWSVRKKFDITGKVFAFYLLLNGIERLLIEQIRVNNKFHLLGMMVTQAEVIAVVLIGLGLSGLFFLKKKNQPLNEIA